MKKKVLIDIGIACGVYILIWFFAIIGEYLASPWSEITNVLWALSIGAFTFFICMGFYHLYKYSRGER